MPPLSNNGHSKTNGHAVPSLFSKRLANVDVAAVMKGSPTAKTVTRRPVAPVAPVASVEPPPPSATAQGTDEIEIGSPLLEGETAETRAARLAEAPKAGSMADVMKLVDSVRYLVKGWIPFGMLTMLLAPPGMGKSAFALFALVRTIIVGGLEWFNGTAGPTEPGDVLLCETESAWGITALRVTDGKLPLDRIRVPFESDPTLPINLMDESHLKQIEVVINKHKIKLVVIDSLRGAHGEDENSSAVTKVVKTLAEIAERTKAAIIIVHHTRKLGPDEELTNDSSRGSNAITAMVRSQLGIDKPDPKSDWCRLQMLKENLGLKPKPIGFRISSEGLEFGEAPTKPRKENQKTRAEAWVKNYMKPGVWYDSDEITREAVQAGFSKTAAFEARTALGCKAKKVKGGWQAMLPGPGEKESEVKNPGTDPAVSG